MQTIAINQGMALGQPAPATTPGTTTPGSDFMALMLQMMGQSEEADPMGALLGQAEQALPGMSGDEEENSVSKNYLMQLMAAMLGQGMAPIAQYNSGAPAAAPPAEQLAAAAQALPAGSDTPLLAAMGQPVQPQAPLEQQLAQQLFQLTSQAPANQAPAEQGASVELLTKDYLSAAEAAAPDSLTQLQSAYAQLNRPQLQRPAPKESGIPDIDALQQAVDSGRFLAASGMAAPQQLLTGAQPQALDILAQVKTGILANLDKGKNEFVLKLKPEGLGEITVKLVEVGGKISMSIITSTQQAQNALNHELPTLREALRPYNAEVQQVIQQETAFSQSFGQQRHQQQSQQQTSSFYWEHQPEGEAQPASYTQTLASALNAYI